MSTDPEELVEGRINLGDETKQKEKALTDLALQLREENDIRAVLALPEGRRLLARIFERCGYDENYFNPNAAISAATAGRRQVAHSITGWIRSIRPDGFELWRFLDAEWQNIAYPPPETKKRKPKMG